MSSIKLIKRLTVTDKQGKVVYDKKSEAHSFVIGFLLCLLALMNDRTDVSATDASGTPQTITDANPGIDSTLNLDAVTGEDQWGIVVGTDPTAPANTDIALGTLIAHGTGAGQLNYGATTFVDTVVVGANVDLKIVRPFPNSSGGSITVEEVGLYAVMEDNTNNWRFFCIVHDLTGGVVVADGETLTVTYTLRTTV